MEDHDLRRVMWIVILIVSLTLGMVFDSFVIYVLSLAADFIVYAFSNRGIPANYFYDKSWHISQIVPILHDFITMTDLVVIISLIIILIWIIVRHIARPRVNGLDV
jgi:phosphoglycerol transferase MdoB-like AlkP superfamily enzyme